MRALIALLFTFSAWALPPELDPPLRAGAMISVEKYDPASQTFKLILTREPAVGPNIAMVEDLIASVSSLDAAKVRANPRAIVGNEYRVDKELRLLSEKGVAIRKKKLSAAKR